MLFLGFRMFNLGGISAFDLRDDVVILLIRECGGTTARFYSRSIDTGHLTTADDQRRPASVNAVLQEPLQITERPEVRQIRVEVEGVAKFFDNNWRQIRDLD